MLSNLACCSNTILTDIALDLSKPLFSKKPTTEFTDRCHYQVRHPNQILSQTTGLLDGWPMQLQC